VIAGHDASPDCHRTQLGGWSGLAYRSRWSVSPRLVSRPPCRYVLERSYERLVAKDESSPEVPGRTRLWLKLNPTDRQGRSVEEGNA